MKIKKEDYIYLLHKTIYESTEFIEEIFNNGLKSWYGSSIDSTMWKVDKETLRETNLEEIIKNYLGDSENYNSVVVIKIPKEYMADRLHRTGQISTPIPLWKDNGDGTMYFTPHLIQGIYCKNIGKGITNTNFTPVCNPTGLKYSDEQINNMWALGQIEWVNYANKRKELTYSQLSRFDKERKTWDNIVEDYSDKFGSKPINRKFTLNNSDRKMLKIIKDKELKEMLKDNVNEGEKYKNNII